MGFPIDSDRGGLWLQLGFRPTIT